MIKPVLRLSRIILLLGLAFASLLIVPGWVIEKAYAGRIHPLEELSPRPVAIVFGAGLLRDGRPTTVLADRIETALDLYDAGLVEKVLFSGSSQPTGYNEAESMFAYALELGFDPEAALLDPGGDRTLVTCQRAKDLFGITQATLVTQRFHLPRALVLCDAIGIDAEGAASDLRTYRAQQFWNVRESFATLRALWDAGMIRVSKSFRT